MPIYHVTVNIDPSGNEFYFSGEGSNLPPWKNNAETLEYFSNCDGSDEDHEPGEAYKFDQSDPTNNGHPLHFSPHEDGTHNGYLSMGASSGVYQCGTPGSPGAFTEVNVGYWYDDLLVHEIYPFCLNHEGMGDLTSFDVAEELNGVCSNNYGGWLCAPDACTLRSHLTGVLTGLIRSTKQELSGEYSNYTITSSAIQTGYHTGQFEACHIVGTGITSGEANTRRMHFTNLFYHSGICVNESQGLSGKQNVNNVGISFGTTPPVLSVFNDGYQSELTGFADRKRYVTYSPTISGQKIKVTADINCPETEVIATLNRNETTWVSSGLAIKAAGWDGYVTTLTAQCKKTEGGYERYCPVNVNHNSSGCWEGDFNAGDYRLKYKSGSFVDPNGLNFIGTGNLTVNKLT